MAYHGRQFFGAGNNTIQQKVWDFTNQRNGNGNNPPQMNYFDRTQAPANNSQNKGSSGFQNNRLFPANNMQNRGPANNMQNRGMFPNPGPLPNPNNSQLGRGNQSKHIVPRRPVPQQLNNAGPSRRVIPPPANENGNTNNRLSRKRGRNSPVIDLTSSTEDESPSGKRQRYANDCKPLIANLDNRDNIDDCPSLSEEIAGYSRDHSQSEEFLDKKHKLISALQDVVRRKYPNISLHLTGSSINGFGSDTSDADMCLIMHHDRDPDQKVVARKYLRAIERMIRPLKYIKKLQFIPAKVPILKFTDAISGCECDMNINNDMGIRNTHLLRCYSKIDNRVRPLVMAIKRWAKLRNINDASQGTLSSYSLVLMVLHYLQCGCNPPVLYSLQKKYPEYFKKESNVIELYKTEPADHIPCNDSRNKQSNGELLVGFFQYFGEDFSWDTLIMSVRGACTQAKRNNREFYEKYVAVEEPFEGYNVSRSVYQLPKFQMVKKEFRRANQLLKERPSMDHIC